MGFSAFELPLAHAEASANRLHPANPVGQAHPTAGASGMEHEPGFRTSNLLLTTAIAVCAVMGVLTLLPALSHRIPPAHAISSGAAGHDPTVAPPRLADSAHAAAAPAARAPHRRPLVAARLSSVSSSGQVAASSDTSAGAGYAAADSAAAADPAAPQVPGVYVPVTVHPVNVTVDQASLTAEMARITALLQQLQVEQQRPSASAATAAPWPASAEQTSSETQQARLDAIQRQLEQLQQSIHSLSQKSQHTDSTLAQLSSSVQQALQPDSRETAQPRFEAVSERGAAAAAVATPELQLTPATDASVEQATPFFADEPAFAPSSATPSATATDFVLPATAPETTEPAAVAFPASQDRTDDFEMQSPLSLPETDSAADQDLPTWNHGASAPAQREVAPAVPAAPVPAVPTAAAAAPIPPAIPPAVPQMAAVSTTAVLAIDNPSLKPVTPVPAVPPAAPVAAARSGVQSAARSVQPGPQGQPSAGGNTQAVFQHTYRFSGPAPATARQASMTTAPEVRRPSPGAGVPRRSQGQSSASRPGQPSPSGQPQPNRLQRGWSYLKSGTWAPDVDLLGWMTRLPDADPARAVKESKTVHRATSALRYATRPPVVR